MARRRHSRSKVRSSRRRRRVHRNARRMLRNIFGADVMRDVVTPVVGGTVGFVLARYAGNMASARIPQLADPRYGKLAAAAVLIPATFAAAKMSPMVRSNAGAVVLGVGLAAAESFIRNTPLLGGAPIAAAVTAPTAPTATSGFGAYYKEGMLGLGRGYDISHAGAPYKGMLGVGEYVDQPMGEYVDQPMSGLGTMYAAAGIGEYVDQPLSGGGDGLSGLAGLGEPGDQGQVDRSMNRMESISTIVPTDLALRAPNRPQVKPVTKPFASGDQGYAGGTFARHLFSGMVG